MMSLELGITVCLLCLVTVRIWGVNYATKHNKSALLRCVKESMFIILPVMGSFALSIWAYIGGEYGLAGPWCWIKSVDENCHPYDFQFQMLYYWIYETIGVCGLIVSVVFSIVYCRLSRTFQEARQLLRRTLCFMIFQLVSIFTHLFRMLLRVYTSVEDAFALWVVYAVISPLKQLVLPLEILICFYPIGNMINSTFYCFTRRKQFQARRREGNFDISQKRTVPKSTRVSPWSHTYFVPLHESYTLPEESCRNVDNGNYGSIGSTH